MIRSHATVTFASGQDTPRWVAPVAVLGLVALVFVVGGIRAVNYKPRRSRA